MSRSTVTASTYVIRVLKSVLESLLVAYKYCNRTESESGEDELTVTSLMVQFFWTSEPRLLGQGLPEQTVPTFWVGKSGVNDALLSLLHSCAGECFFAELQHYQAVISTSCFHSAVARMMWASQKCDKMKMLIRALSGGFNHLSKGPTALYKIKQSWMDYCAVGFFFYVTENN